MGAREFHLGDLGRRHLALVFACAIVAAVCALYLPFLSNPLVFDDKGYFTGRDFAEHALSPFGLAPRYPAFFSIAWVQTVFGGVQAHRVVSLALHAAVACSLYLLIRRLLERTERPANAATAAAAGALAFALHPMAVYGASYLAQRSLVMATLFSVLSAAVFVQGLASSRYRYAFGAAALFSLAVLSKEHAIVLPGVVALAAWLFADSRRFTLRYLATYLAACAPAGLLILLILKGIIGTIYENQFYEVADQVAAASTDAAGLVRTPWLASVFTQAALFPRYAALWLWPDTGAMSFDLKVDFAPTWGAMAAAAAIGVYLLVGAAGFYLLWRRGRWGVAGFGILWFWAMYVLEFSVVRFQEPFVLYRSYLWGPGIAIAVAACIARLSPRIVVAAGIAAAAALSWQAHDRLLTFSSGLRLWEDAVAKLPPTRVPGGSRPLYELGREYFYGGQAEKAAAVLERCLQQYPELYHCVFARAAVLISVEEYARALPDLERALAVRPRDGPARHHLGLALERLGCREAAIEQYESSLKMGFAAAAERLKSIRNPGQGLLPAAPVSKVAAGFDCAAASKRYAAGPQ